MRDTAAYLAVNQHGIDEGARVLQRHVVQKLDAAGVGIDLDFRDMAGIGVGERVGAPIDIGVEARLDVRREAIAGRAFEDAREFTEIDRKLRRADDPHLAVCDLEIVLRRLEHVARELLRLLSNRSCREEHG